MFGLKDKRVAIGLIGWMLIFLLILIALLASSIVHLTEPAIALFVTLLVILFSWTFISMGAIFSGITQLYLNKYDQDQQHIVPLNRVRLSLIVNLSFITANVILFIFVVRNFLESLMGV